MNIEHKLSLLGLIKKSGAQARLANGLFSAITSGRYAPTLSDMKFMAPIQNVIRTGFRQLPAVQQGFSKDPTKTRILLNQLGLPMKQNELMGKAHVKFLRQNKLPSDYIGSGSLDATSLRNGQIIPNITKPMRDGKTINIAKLKNPNPDPTSSFQGKLDFNKLMFPLD